VNGDHRKAFARVGWSREDSAEHRRPRFQGDAAWFSTVPNAVPTDLENAPFAGVARAMSPAMMTDDTKFALGF